MVLLVFCIAGSSQQYCNMESFNATCPNNQVILVKSAKYGRMQIGRCVKRNLGYLGCSVDVLVYMDRECSGQKKCEINIPNPTLYATQPCPEDTTPYLEVAYECIPGKNPMLKYASACLKLLLCSAICLICNTTIMVARIYTLNMFRNLVQ